MKKKLIESYKISGDKIVHMKLTKLNLPENETQTMLERYRFDEEGTSKIISEIEKSIEEINIAQEQKEYEEMNYCAICKRMYKYSILELLQELALSIFK